MSSNFEISILLNAFSDEESKIYDNYIIGASKALLTNEFPKKQIVETLEKIIDTLKSISSPNESNEVNDENCTEIVEDELDEVSNEEENNSTEPCTFYLKNRCQ